MNYALITGGSKGIGKEIALELAKRKYNLLLVARSGEELSKTSEEIKKLCQVEVAYLECDLSISRSAEKISNWCTEKGFSIEILVNNAGYGLWGYFEKLSLESQREMMQVNMASLTELTYLILPFLKKNSKAYILNIASTAAYQAVPSLSVYAATKAYVLVFTRGLRFELKKSGVSVTCLSPGATDTNFTSRAGMQAMQAVADKFNMKSDLVAKIGLNGMFNGSAEIIPGLVNLLSVKAADFLPKSLIETIAANLYIKHLK